jgi:tRNA dimethylallyltransferase
MAYDAVLIAGPTASGKSAAALMLAEKLGGAIINADSMQVYREAPILTAQPAPADQRHVPHLLYGHVSARQVYSVGRYAEDAAAALAAVRASGKLPIFVGGTGLYFMALTDGLAQIPETPPGIRETARARLDEIGVAALHAELMTLDPKTAAGLRPSDPQRVLRAYEVFEATGRSLVDWQQSSSEPVLKNMRLAKILLDPPREVLRARIANRFEAMLDQGGLEEAMALKDLDPSLPAAKLLGLRPLVALGQGQLSREEALSQAITATRQFAKRQGTWFRHRMDNYVSVDPVLNNIISIWHSNFV